MNWSKQNINQIMVTASGAFLGFLMAGAFTIFTIFGWGSGAITDLDLEYRYRPDTDGVSGE